MLCRERRLRHHRDNDIDLEPGQLLRESGEPVEFPFREPVLNSDVPSLDVAELLEPLPERLFAGHARRAPGSRCEGLSPVAAQPGAAAKRLPSQQ